ncbi:TetR/AcrR family transcriptional regulator [Thalassomonas viridans]|uniref:TetR/AcrR family transcriptional regulator n=1 Tax=Thalassomonas viridans TaxID=137584 RepID=A0AAE9Z5P4_9GAMM|nr:TetR/AcrR family transcriptional regulator [Thalassomonas viridans]WDE06549.1 TetR/AcrR family transcriptional regulator [Thalassomonas viridans]
MKATSDKSKSSYHHGNLQSTLIFAATEMIQSDGVENLSLRKLAERVGVSRTAPYHHFKDKNELLCAVAAQGFIAWREIAEQIFNDASLSPRECYRQFISRYIGFAAENPALYDLMFGGTIWKGAKSTQTLRDIAYPNFQYQVEMTKLWQEKGLMPAGENTLRLAQVTWGTMHGIARLLIDGIYADASSIEEMCECALNLFLAHMKTQA